MNPRPRVRGQLSLLDDSSSVSGQHGDRQQLAAIAAGFDPARLTQARRLAGLTKKAVAEELGVSPVAVSQWEAGTTTPRPDNIGHLAEVLDVIPSFFAAGRPYARLDGSSAHFRSLRRTPATQRDKAIAYTEQVWELAHALEKRVQLPPVDLPTLSADVLVDDPGAPEAAARLLREHWGLQTGPIAHLVRTMETHGLIVTLSPFAGAATATVDAFSTSHLDRPVVVLTPDRANDIYRHRFTAAHELGHLVMHGELATGDPQQEKEADRFAAELLTPSAQITPLLPPRLDLNALEQLGKGWGVSVDSLIYRCREVGAVSDAAYRRAYQRLNQLRKLNLFRPEPVDGYPGEIPVLLTRAFELAEANGLSLRDLAAELSFKLPRLRLLLGEPNTRPELHLIST
ncbi:MULTISPECIES: XRE family transcriptional regulator [unclassified Rhodococcus (in: high G+C Gram-positive bacteria)]|uniref:helix-turn-helix domain-containing protein n=1 Tax=unclassified Rhodococcus (in: high G+C Gram-positive bacteria) TaxID=192944 RepID=UPI0028A1D25D|nr:MULTISPECIES: XRE family transcriptional regulator [unclassified Rhodococcus (in: high G+C Gram-positive bacteria)]